MAAQGYGEDRDRDWDRDSSTGHNRHNSCGDIQTGGPADSNRLLEFVGRSSTVVRLDEKSTIAPGQTLRFEAWLRITKPGVQKISLLASYKRLNEDGTEEFFGPGNRCRTSFLSIQTCGLPALGSALRLVPKASGCFQYTLLIEVSNFMKNLNAAPVVDDWVHSLGANLKQRNSSIGQIDINELLAHDDFFEIDDNCVKIVGAWMMGCALPSTQTSKNHALKELELLMYPGEQLMSCYPLSFFDENNGRVGSNNSLDKFDSHSPRSPVSDGSKSPGYCSWLMPLNDLEKRSNEKFLRKDHLSAIVEQFVCTSSSAEQFEQDIQESRLLMQMANSEADEAGPRTIAQVRSRLRG